MATGIQDSSMVAWKWGSKIWKGVIKYSNSSYWQANGVLKSEYGSSYPAYVYDSNSNLYVHVENYKNYLSSIGASINKARIMTYEEAINFGCQPSGNCSSSYPWIYSTTYWIGSAYNSDTMWRISTNNLLDKDKDYYDVARGIRPIIEIDTSDVYDPTKPSIVSGDVYTVGSEICIRNECFYVVSNDGRSVNMLSKYNLYVGNRYDSKNGPVALSNPTGIQNINARGWNPEDVEPFIGVMGFADSVYWSTVTTFPSYVYDNRSNLYSHIENYKNYLNNLNVLSVSNARLISREELLSVGCTTIEYGCSNAASWVRNTTYWTGSASSKSKMYIVDQKGRFGDNTDRGHNTLGVRPLIEVSLKEFNIINTFSTSSDKLSYDNVKYIEGMTWEEFINSDLNDGSFYISGSSPAFTDEDYSPSCYLYNYSLDDLIKPITYEASYCEK